MERVASVKCCLQDKVVAPAAVREVDLVSRVWPASEAQKPKVG